MTNPIRPDPLIIPLRSDNDFSERKEGQMLSTLREAESLARQMRERKQLLHDHYRIEIRGYFDAEKNREVVKTVFEGGNVISEELLLGISKRSKRIEK